MINLSNWFDENGLLHLHKNPTTDSSENGVLFTTEFLILARLLKEPYFYKHWQVVEAFLKEDPKKPMSHDNATAVACAAKYIKQKPVPIFSKRRLHPRDIIFYGWVKYPYLFLPFLWIPCLAMVYACNSTYKYRYLRSENDSQLKVDLINMGLEFPMLGKYFRKKYNHIAMIDTDGKLLTFIRCHAFNMHRTFRWCTKLIYGNSKLTSWTKVSQIYFKDPEHPVRLLMEEWERDYRTWFLSTQK